jgi:hypothetical protein
MAGVHPKLSVNQGKKQRFMNEQAKYICVARGIYKTNG